MKELRTQTPDMSICAQIKSLFETDFELHAVCTAQKMFLLAFSFANFETTRGSRGKANISF